MKCANCNNELAPITYEGAVVVDACAQCSGMYFDSGELEKIQDNKDNDYSDMLACHPPLLEQTFEMARQKHLSNKTCPKCKVEMHRREWLTSQILIDVCSECFGVWLDKGELQTLELYYERLSQKISRDISDSQEVEKKGFWASLKSLVNK